jgi:hypothetical protein
MIVCDLIGCGRIYLSRLIERLTIGICFFSSVSGIGGKVVLCKVGLEKGKLCLQPSQNDHTKNKIGE